MNESKHTPGPWVVDREYFAITHPADCNPNACNLVAYYARKPDGTHEANAHLIAAAPDLFECLVSAIEGSGYCVSGPTHPDVAQGEGEPKWVAFARAVIAKATGNE